MAKKTIDSNAFRTKVQSFFDKKMASDKSLTFNAICKLAGLRSQTVSRFLKGETSPTLTTCEKLEDYMVKSK